MRKHFSVYRNGAKKRRETRARDFECCRGGRGSVRIDEKDLKNRHFCFRHGRPRRGETALKTPRDSPKKSQIVSADLCCFGGCVVRTVDRKQLRFETGVTLGSARVSYLRRLLERRSRLGTMGWTPLVGRAAPDAEACFPTPRPSLHKARKESWRELAGWFGGGAGLRRHSLRKGGKQAAFPRHAGCSQ
jgi:hypothetical protein